MAQAPHRRTILRILAGTAGLLPWTARPQDAPRDQGIGGTGARPDPTPAGPPGGPLPGGPLPGGGDRGLGGTGVIGTIRRFGSIIVNDLRIAYPQDVAVRIDGEPATAAALRIGQVVHVVARPGQGGLSTQRIEVASEVVGPVESAAPGRLVVLGQRVTVAGLAGEWKPGTRVAVSGLRRPDGVIVASLVERRDTGPDRVAGPVRRAPDGTLAIGGLRLRGADTLPPGKRAMVTGAAEAGALRVTNAAETGLPFPPGLRSLSIEAYIGRTGSGLELGSGLPVNGRPGAAIPRQGSVRAVVTARVAPDGNLTVERLRAEERIAPQAPGRDDPRPEEPRFRYERDNLDLRNIPDRAPGRIGGEPGGREPGPSFNLRPGGGDIRPPQEGGPSRGPDFTPLGAGDPRLRVPGMTPGPNTGPGPGPMAPGFLGPAGPPGLRR